MHIQFLAVRTGFSTLLVLLAVGTVLTDSVFGAVLPPEITETAVEHWEPTSGDRLVIDTKENIGYLVHLDGGFTSFPVLTGQRRTVRYIGRIYNATTPVRTWEARDIDIKGDKTTFGPRGIFLRLFYKEERTAYGIHSHRSMQEMLGGDTRFRSMGCILVTDDVLDVILRSFALNEDRMVVRTVYGFDDQNITFPLLLSLVSKAV